MEDKDYLDIIKFLKGQGLEYEASIIEDLSKENTALKQQLDITVEALEKISRVLSGHYHQLAQDIAQDIAQTALDKVKEK